MGYGNCVAGWRMRRRWLGIAICVSMTLGIWPGMVTAPAGAVEPWDPTNPRQNERPREEWVAFCALRVDRWLGMPDIYIPCAKQATLTEFRQGSCPGEECGHVPAAHTPDNARAVGYDLAGYLTDDVSGTVPTYDLPMYDGCADDVVRTDYTFRYMAGQVMGRVQVRITFRITDTLLACEPWMERLRFLHRSEDPASCCVQVLDGGRTCICIDELAVRYGDLVELPPPRVMTTMPWAGELYPYVRCGRVRTCRADSDTPDAWAMHPAVHWGRVELVQALQCLADAWFRRCSLWAGGTPPPPWEEDAGQALLAPQNLAVTDMSLPGGGLLDIRGDWQPVARSRYQFDGCASGDRSCGHRWHRYGVDADLVGVSVPEDGRCGQRPTSTWDSAWRSTPLWERGQGTWIPSEMLRQCGLTSFRNDPGHVQLRVSGGGS